MRAPVISDAEAVLAVLRARDVADRGAAEYTLGELRDEWSLSDFELARDAVVVTDPDGRITGYAIVRDRGAYAVIAPADENRGHGTRLLAWVEERQRQRGDAVHRQWVVAGSEPALALLRGRGYVSVRSFYRMERALRPAPAAPVPPPGISERPIDPEHDASRLHEIDDAAFRTTAEYHPETLTVFTEEHFAAHDAEPALGAVAEDGGVPVGFLVARRRPGAVGYIDLLAVHPDHFGRGIGRFLLHSAFARMAAAGLETVQLGVAGDNPRALHIYEAAGMVPGSVIETLARPVTGAGSDRPDTTEGS